MSSILKQTDSQHYLLVDTGVLNKLLRDMEFSEEFWRNFKQHCLSRSLRIVPTPFSFIEYIGIKMIDLKENYFLEKKEIRKRVFELNDNYILLKESVSEEGLSSFQHNLEVFLGSLKDFFNLFFDNIKEEYSRKLKLSDCDLDACIEKLLESCRKKRRGSELRNKLDIEKCAEIDELTEQLENMLIEKIKNIENKTSDIYDYLSVDFYSRFNYKKSEINPVNADIIIFEAIKTLYANYHQREKGKHMSQFRSMIAVAHRVYGFHKENRSRMGKCSRETKEILETIGYKIHKFRDLFDLEHIQSSCIGVFNEEGKCLPIFVAVGVDNKKEYKDKELELTRDRVRNFKMILREFNKNELIREKYAPIPLCEGTFLFVDSGTGEILERLDVSSVDILTLDPIISKIFKEFPFHHPVFEKIRLLENSIRS